MKKLLIFVTVLLLTISVIFILKKENRNFNFSYYFWENNYNLEQDTNDKLYIKVLDIKYSNKLEIIETNFIKSAPKDFIPVVFITNKTLQNLDYKVISDQIINLVKKFNFNEIQIDCDWSDSTKNNYFLLLKELKNNLNKNISATIRLHQIKYFNKTGVPPVDYGVLMYYNMSSLGDFNTKNYILDNNEAKKYHYNFENYPLKLKLALPLYSQAVQFRDKKAINLFENVEQIDFNEEFEKLDENKYKVLKSHYFKGKYIYEGDILRFENVNEKELKIAFDDFFELSKNSFDEVIFYTIKYKTKYNLENLLKN
ncbi:hypothetical protein [Aliarcobacter cibarius]|uniref:Uncharacterized protein n=1 Tax=Aliarcobacter cibarius TaxID=255507 RepID=A0ABY2V4H5_9BACT|nr:hypothetical protein [Aliarcobacter cibarius]TLS99576.1 hypothetical protein FE247_05700 [Aliarcobacter cibarius]TLT00013.1 hypothetical protein FE245_05975 [Aliarcobacter cibarius]TLT03493.1 hypothetical protein FE248_07100 [Aliarcobacter cibarius]